MQTIESIIGVIEKRILNNEPISPASYIEAALRVHLLSSSIDNQVAIFEAQMIAIEAEYLKTDMSSAKAKTLSKSEIEYEDYLKLKAQQKHIHEWVLLAKRRAVTPEM